MPAGITQYVLRGGPCDGNTGDLTPEIDQSGELVCKGYTYKRVEPAQVVNARELFRVAGKVAPPSTGAKAARAHHGWTDLQRSINHTMPKALRSSQRNSLAALRLLQRARKVKL